MSGIYGIFSSSNSLTETNSVASALGHLSTWNQAYGNGKSHDTSLPYCSMGIYDEHISNAPINCTPVLKKEGWIAVIDAILYNREELATQYFVSPSLSDEEMLFECIVAHGFPVLAHINGDFAGALLNTDTKELVLFRDHMGVRPLFYFQSEGWTAFSTDIRGLVAIPQLPIDVNPDWLYKNVCGYDSENLDIEYKGIHFVKPSSYITIRIKESRLTYTEQQYWQLGKRKIRFRTQKDYFARLRELITESVKQRIHVFPDKIGAELSGGLDSGVIDILINRLGREGIYYSWSFSPDDLPLVPNDERQVIADICEQEHIVCHYGNETMDLGPNSNIGINHIKTGINPDYEQSTNFHYALPSYINTLIICETAQFIQEHGGKVVFSGHGGDEGVSHRCGPYELFYHGEYLHFLLNMWKRSKGKKHRILQTLRHSVGTVRFNKKELSKPFQYYINAGEIFREAFVAQYRDKPMPQLTFSHDVIPYINSGNTRNRLEVTALLGAYSGARYVFPYLDYQVIDFAVSIPRHLYLNGTQNRYLFRQAFRDIMPESLYTCTAKNNPSTAHVDHSPPTDWFEIVHPYMSSLLDKLDRDFWNRFLDFDYLEKWIQEGRPSEEDTRRYLNISNKISLCYEFQYKVKQIRDYT